MQFRKKKDKDGEIFFSINEEDLYVDRIFFQDFVYLSEKTLGLFLLEIVESGLISNKYNFDREQETPVDSWFIYSPAVLSITAF